MHLSHNGVTLDVDHNVSTAISGNQVDSLCVSFCSMSVCCYWCILILIIILVARWCSLIGPH